MICSLTKRFPTTARLYGRKLSSSPIISPSFTNPIFDSLYEIRRSGYDVQIPRIVMTGNQSSGKTSLLEAMCSINNLFEKKAGLATKRPMYIYLNKIAEGEADYVKIGTLGEKITNMDKARLRISEENNIDGISEVPLDVAIYSPNISYSCNLIDLPGFISTVKQGQDEGLPAKIKKINEKYVIDDANLKLIVMSSTEDVALSLALKEIKKSYQLHNSIGVFTKIDLVTNDHIGTKQLEDLLLDKSYTTFKCVGVKLRSTADINEGVNIPQMIRNEETFIEKFKLNQNPEIKIGINTLMKDISDEQIKRISHRLPEIRDQLSAMIEKKRHGNSVLDRLIQTNDMSAISEELDRIITEIHPESDLRIELEKKIYNKVNEYVSSFVSNNKLSQNGYKLLESTGRQTDVLPLDSVRYCLKSTVQTNLGTSAGVNSHGTLLEVSDADAVMKNLIYGLCKADVESSELDRIRVSNFNKGLIVPFYKLEKNSGYNKSKFIKDIQKVIANMVSSKFSENIVNIVLGEIKEHILQKNGNVDDIGKVFFVHIFDKICQRANQDELKRAITRMIIRERRLNVDYPKLIYKMHEILRANGQDSNIEKMTGFFGSEKFPLVIEMYGPLMYSAYLQCLSDEVSKDAYRLTAENLLDPIITNAIKYSLDTVAKKDFTSEQETIKKQIDKLTSQLGTLDVIIKDTEKKKNEQMKKDAQQNEEQQKKLLKNKKSPQF